MRFWRACSLFVLVLGVLFLVGGEADASPPLDKYGPWFTLSSDSIRVTWSAPPMRTRMGQNGRVTLEMPGYVQSVVPGTPEIPLTSVLVALPPGADPTLDVVAVRETRRDIPGPLAVVPEPQDVVLDPQGEVLSWRYSPLPLDPDFRPAPVELEVIGSFRGVQLARLVYYPVAPLGDEILLRSTVTAVLYFNVGSQTDLLASPSEDPLLADLKSLVVNPEQVIPSPRVKQPLRRTTTPNAASQVAFVEVAAPGITEITYQALADAGFPVATVDPANLQLTHEGGEVAMWWDGDGDALFEAGERLLFYANPRLSRWTARDTYILSEGSTGGLRMASRDASPVGLPVGQAMVEKMAQENNTYVSEIPAGWDGDRWFWESLSRPTDTVGDYLINLPSVNTSQPGSLTLWMVSYTDVSQDPDHRVAVYLNSNPLVPATIEWNGKQLVAAQFSVPAGTFQAGDNTLTVSLPGIVGVDVEGIWVDAFALQYALGTASAGNAILFQGEATQRAYAIPLDDASGVIAWDVTDPTLPVRLTGLVVDGNLVSLGDPEGGDTRQYAVANPNGIQSPASVRLKAALSTQEAGFPGADYIIITHEAFTPALADLVALRQSQGLDVVIVETQPVYDHYDDGRPTPDAIRAFLQDAYDTWPTRPLYVLLVGDGTTDPKHHQPNSFDTYLPPYLADVDPWLGETAADNRYVTLDGADIIPDMIIGRLPVNSLAEAQAVVDKIVNYETAPEAGSWYQEVVFVADNADGGGDFPSDAEYLASNFVPDQYAVERIYHADGTPVAQTQADILQAWNDGASLVTYIGHGSQHTWAAETLFHISSIATLTNGGRLPFAMELTCLTGAFHTAGLDALDEELLRHPTGGAVAVWGPTGFGLAHGHVQLAEGFLQKAFVENQPQVGPAILAGKLNLLTQAPSYADLVDTYTLFGDPAQNLHIFEQHALYIPLILR